MSVIQPTKELDIMHVVSAIEDILKLRSLYTVRKYQFSKGGVPLIIYWFLDEKRVVVELSGFYSPIVGTYTLTLYNFNEFWYTPAAVTFISRAKGIQSFIRITAEFKGVQAAMNMTEEQYRLLSFVEQNGG